MDAAVGQAKGNLDRQVGTGHAIGQVGIDLFHLQPLAVLQNAPVVLLDLYGSGLVKKSRVVLPHHLARGPPEQLQDMVVRILVAIVPPLDVDEGAHAVEDGSQLLLADLKVACALLHLALQHHGRERGQQPEQRQPRHTPPRPGGNARALLLPAPAAQNLGVLRVGTAAPVLH
ncbi:hypothetical protein D3C71_1456630 [compost metagenome]